MLEKCSCNHCSGHIEFDSEHAGQMVVCPHCGLETQLFVPFNKKTAPSPSAVQKDVSIEVKRVASPLGIASLVIGIISCIFCVIPFLAFWAIRLALIGVVLSLVGVAMAIRNKKTGFEFSISGGIVNLLSIVIALAMTGEFTALMQKVEYKAGDHKPLVIPSKKQMFFQQGNIKGEIDDIIHGFTTGESATERGLIVKTSNFLLIKVSVFNASSDRIYDYTTLRNGATLTDNKENNYRKIDSKQTVEEYGKVSDGWVAPYPFRDKFYANSSRISPNTGREDMLGFDIPDSPGNVLYLEFPAENFGGAGKIRFEIPVSQIENW